MNSIASINSRFLNKHSIKITWFLAISVLCIVVVSIIWTVLKQSRIKASNYEPQEVQIIAQNNQPIYQVNDIVSANLFGNPTPPIIEQRVAPKTTLDLTLVGVLWSSDNDGRAIIMAGKKASELYSLGEDIKGASASIEEIRSAEVILNRNGALESLPLIKKTANNGQKILVFENETDTVTNSVSSEVGNNNRSRSPIINRANQIQNTANGGSTDNRRVRRPNYTCLYRALEKMGEL